MCLRQSIRHSNGLNGAPQLTRSEGPLKIDIGGTFQHEERTRYTTRYHLLHQVRNELKEALMTIGPAESELN